MSIDIIKSKNLLEAIQKDRLEEVEARLSVGEDVNTVFAMNRTGLHCAVAKTNVRMVETLLKAKPDLTLCDTNGNTVLHVVCSRTGPESERITEMLVTAGHPLDYINNFQRTALEECVVSANVPAAKILVDGGAATSGARKLAAEKDNVELNQIFEKAKVDSKMDEDGMDCAAAAKDNSIEMIDVVSTPPLSVQEEKNMLLKRLAELEEKEISDLKTKLGEKKINFEKERTHFKFKREETQKEIDHLESQLFAAQQKMTNLKKEEEIVLRSLQSEISTLSHDIDKRRIKEIKGLDVVGCLDCPVCLDICKPPVQIFQCPEGHIMCGDCANRPELEVCPQCRMPLDGQISRNRALEELARRTFPKEEEESRKRRGESGANNHQRTNSGRTRPRPFSRPTSSRFGNVQSQVDQLINFTSLSLSNNLEDEWANSDEDWSDSPTIPDMVESGDTYWSDEEEQEVEEVFISSAGFRAPPAIQPSFRQHGHWAPGPLSRSPRRGNRRRSPILAPGVVSSRISPPGTSSTSTFSRGSDRGSRRNRPRGQWGRPNDLRFLR